MVEGLRVPTLLQQGFMYIQEMVVKYDERTGSRKWCDPLAEGWRIVEPAERVQGAHHASAA